MNWKIIALLALLALVGVAHATRESEELEVEDSHENAADMSAEEMLESEMEVETGKKGKGKGESVKKTAPAQTKKPAKKNTMTVSGKNLTLKEVTVKKVTGGKKTAPVQTKKAGAVQTKKPTKKNAMTVNGKKITLKKVTVKPTLPKPRPTQYKLEAHKVPTKKPLTKKEKKAQAEKEPIYLGCYKDGKVRAVPHRRGKVGGFFKTGSVKSTMHQCEAMAKKNGDVFFALQNGNECWSGKAAETNYAMYGVEKDAAKCKDKDGGPFTNKVYSINF